MSQFARGPGNVLTCGFKPRAEREETVGSTEEAHHTYPLGLCEGFYFARLGATRREPFPKRPFRLHLGFAPGLFRLAYPQIVSCRAIHSQIFTKYKRHALCPPRLDSFR